VFCLQHRPKDMSLFIRTFEKENLRLNLQATRASIKYL